MSEHHPSTSILAGQLSYLFDDEPALRAASDEELTARLNHDDRYARARAKYPLDSDDELRTRRLSEFSDRITVSEVRTAREQAAERP